MFRGNTNFILGIDSSKPLAITRRA